MINMEDDTLIAQVDDDNAPEAEASDTSSQEFTKPLRDTDNMVSFIEREVDSFDFDGYEVVRRELFSKANCPAVTMKYGKVIFNIRAIRKMDECSHIQILMNQEEKKMIAKPCGEEEKDSVQWSRVDKRGKVVSRQITGNVFTAQLFNDMHWDLNSTIKVLGTQLTCKGEKLFVFELINAEAYLSIAAPSADNPKRRERIPYMPEHWQGTYGPSYEDSKKELIKTFEDVPEGFVKIVIPQMPPKKPKATATELFDQTDEPEKDDNGTI